jgi:hypothetical protein
MSTNRPDDGGIVSQLVEAYARSERLAGWSWLKVHFISSAVFQCMEYHWTMKSKTKDFLFFVFQSVSRADTVNMNGPPLDNTYLKFPLYVYRAYYNFVLLYTSRAILLF